MTDHIIQSEDGQTYDLTTNRVVFGLLPKDVQEAMKAWPHKWEMFNGLKEWEHRPTPAWSPTSTYRAIPAPKVTKHVLFWKAGYYATDYRAPTHTHRIVLRDDGKGNVSATVEKL